MAAAGIAAVVEPAFWVGRARTFGTLEDYFLSLLGWERFRSQQFGIRHYCTLALNPKRPTTPPSPTACSRSCRAISRRTASSPWARGRARHRERTRPVVLVPVLARRRARARLHAHRRHPPQARLRRRRAVPRPGARVAQAQDRGDAAAAQAALPRSPPTSSLSTRPSPRARTALPDAAEEGPLFITNDPARLPPRHSVDARQVKDAVLSHVFSS